MEENRTLLIVDDEAETLRGYKDFLTPKDPGTGRRSSRRTGTDESSGEPVKLEQYNLLLASSGEEAVQLFENEIKNGRRVAAGFFDVKLEGGMDGLQTIMAIKNMDKDIHCVVVTAYHDRSLDEINRMFGEEFKDHWDYLNKPFTQSEIIQKARQMVAAWNRRRELEWMNAQLVRSERMNAVAQVARGIGHEFGNILLRIIGKTDLALMESDVQKIHDHLKVVMAASERASAIVRNLQSFAKADPNFVSSPISASVEEAVALIAHEMEKNGITLNKNFKTKRPQRIDVGGMAQVFLNLFINATHAMPKGGAITVTIEEAASEDGKPGVVTRVADQGTGIPEHVLPRIFEFAFTTKGDRGSGLGLSVSKEIVTAHGGTISVKSDEGKGTEFFVWLPLNADGKG